MNMAKWTKAKQPFVPSNCIDCPHHEVVPDPDPNDWFEDDDVAVQCNLTPDRKKITSGCRPYNRRKESATPGQRQAVW